MVWMFDAEEGNGWKITKVKRQLSIVSRIVSHSRDFLSLRSSTLSWPKNVKLKNNRRGNLEFGFTFFRKCLAL